MRAMFRTPPWWKGLPWGWCGVLRAAVLADVAVAFDGAPPWIIMSRYSSSVMPVMLPAICWKLLPSVAPILARK
jgi:hypothetical protein